MTQEFEMKELGQSGIRVPALALGTWQYRAGPEPLRTGIEMGAAFIDTAESYGNEDIVGQAIQGIRERVFVATKALPRAFGRENLIHAAEKSLKRLRTDYIDLYQLHWPNSGIPIEETMGAMEKLVESGKARFVGVSNFSAAEFDEAQKALSGKAIVADQVRYSLVDRTIEDELLPFCQSRRVTVLAYSPLDSGLKRLRRFDRHDVLGKVARETGKTRAQVALNWCLSQEPVIAIFRGGTVEHVRENCGAAGWRLDKWHLDQLNGIPFRYRGPMERFARRVARRIVQKLGGST